MEYGNVKIILHIGSGGLKNPKRQSRIPEYHMEHNPGLWPVFRARHGSRIVCMFVTLKVTLKVTSGESNRRMVPAVPDGSRSISLVRRRNLINLERGTICETQGMRVKLWHD